MPRLISFTSPFCARRKSRTARPPSELSLIAFPTRELFLEKLDQFDLVIFDRYQRQSILPDAYLANVADYVREWWCGAGFFRS